MKSRLQSKLALTAILFGLLSVTFLSTVALAQIQLGVDIDGEAAGDEFGESVSLSFDGNRLAVGADRNDGNGTHSGHVRIFQWLDGAWAQLGADIDGEAAENDSGNSVSLSSDGNRVAIGAPWNSDFFGHVRVYQWSGADWIQLGSDIDGEAREDFSGWAVSLSSDGDRLAIGAPNAGATDSGHVRVYQWSGTNWAQFGVDIDGEGDGDTSGRSVSLSSDGQRLAIGAQRNRGDTGHVRVYQWSGTAWVQLGADIDGAEIEEWLWFGSSVSLSSDGSRLAVGAPKSDGNGIDSGHVSVYQWSGTVWVQIGADINGEAADDESGKSVSLSSDGNRLAIGADRNDGNGENSGHVRIYQWSGSDWVQIGVDIDGEAIDDYSAKSVALSRDGNRLAIGAIYANEPDSGHVRVYDLSMLNGFRINAGLNDAWYFPETDGQGFFINVFPDMGYVSLAWFTYDTELPPIDAISDLGDPGHRWLTALGMIDGNQVLMNIVLTSGGIFDTSTAIFRTDPPGSDGTILLTFDSCSTGTIEYDIPSINRQGVVPIERVAYDNIALCEALNAQ